MGREPYAPLGGASFALRPTTGRIPPYALRAALNSRPLKGASNACADFSWYALPQGTALRAPRRRGQSPAYRLIPKKALRAAASLAPDA